MSRLLMTAALVGSLVWMVGASGPASALERETSSLAGTVTTSDPDISRDYFLQSCGFTQYNLPLQAAFYTMTASATGTYFFMSSMSPVGHAYFGVFNPTYSQADCVATDYGTGKVDLTQGVTYTFVVWLCSDSDCIDDFSGSFDVSAEGPGTLTWTSQRVASSTPVPPWVQSYGRAAETDTCLAGWSPSWEEWPNGRKGGWVCTRSIPSLGSQTD